MAFLDVLGGIGSALSPFLGVGSSMLNMYREDYWNKRQEDMTREAWQREDTAIQRRVADLKAAGLNPALAASSAASSSGAANFTSSNQMQANFDEWIKSPINRQLYKQEKYKTEQEKNYNQILKAEAAQANFDMIMNENYGKLFGINLNSKGNDLWWSYNDNDPNLARLRNIYANQFTNQLVSSDYNLRQTKYMLEHQDFTNAMNLFSTGISPLLDVLDVAGSLRRNFGTYKGDFTYRRR